MKYVIFGPPAAGKSTLAQHIPTRIKDASVIHLEKIEGPYRLPMLYCLNVIPFMKPLFVTAAEMRLEWIPPAFEIIFLIPDTLASYRTRYTARNQADPGKANQKEEEVYSGMAHLRDHKSERFRIIIDPTQYEGNVNALLTEILSRLHIVADLG